MRVLLSSVGRRGYLVKYFKEALSAADEVWGADSSPYTPAFRYCDKAVLLPEVGESKYIDTLLRLCRDSKIDMVIPLIDLELEVLSAHREVFDKEGVLVVVSPPKTIELTFDKYLTYASAKQAGIAVPQTVTTVRQARQLLSSGQLNWPVVVKPRKGSASVNITYCTNEKQLDLAFDTCPGPIVQEFLAGDEYGYDLLSDRQFKPVGVFCKRKLAMRAGETDKAVSVNDKELVELGVRIAQAFPMFGPADVDVRMGADGPKLLEVNPRFGGGYPCAHLCGMDFPAKLAAICRGEKLSPGIGAYRAGVYMFKQDEIITPRAEDLDSLINNRQQKNARQ